MNMGRCFVVKETRTVAVWVEEGTRDAFFRWVKEHLVEIDDALDNAGAEWEYIDNGILREEDCELNTKEEA